MPLITPYIKGIFPVIEGNDRVYFDSEFRKIQEALSGILEALTAGVRTDTIATGAITLIECDNPVIVVTVDTEAAAASDDLDTITGGKAGQLLIVKAANDARTVVAKDSTGNLELSGDITLDNTQDTLILINVSGTEWHQLSSSDNGA